MWRSRLCVCIVFVVVSATEPFVRFALKFCIGFLYENLGIKVHIRFIKKQPSDGHALVEGVKDFYPCFPCLLTGVAEFGVVYLHALPVSSCEFS